MLAITLRQNKQVQGIPVGDIIHLLGQFADDMDLYLKNDQDTLNQVLRMLGEFQSHSGFTVSYEKTQIYRIGSLKKSNAMLYTTPSLKWTSDPINVLGVTIAHDDIINRNYESIIDKTASTLKMWSKRSLSLIGKVLITNSLTASLFVYKMMVLPRIPSNVLQKYENLITEFLWNGRKPKVTTKMLQMSKAQGGLNLVNLQLKEISLKCTWPSILKDKKDYADLVYQMIAPVLKEHIWCCNIHPNDVNIIIPRETNAFWYDILWCHAKLKLKQGIYNDFIWYNSLIRIAGKPFLWKHPYERGLMYVRDLYNENGNIKSALMLSVNYGLTLMELNSLISAIPKEYKQQPSTPVQEHVVPKSSKAYVLLNDNKGALLQKCEKWSHELQIDIRYDLYQKGFSAIYKVTNVPKFRSFQFRLLHRAIITNIHLNRWGKSDTDLCSFCKIYPETYRHLFVECKVVSTLWMQVERMMDKYSKDQIHFDIDTVLWNMIIQDNPGHIKNFLCLITKQYIYRQSSAELNANILKTERIEKYIAIKNDREHKHTCKWYPNVKNHQDIPRQEDFIARYINEIST